MSPIALRSLLIPENKQSQSVNENSIVKSLLTDENQSRDTAFTFNSLDSLRLSDFTAQSIKGRVPITLMQPDEISNYSPATNTKPKNYNTSGSSKLSALTGLNNSGKPIPEIRAYNEAMNLKINVEPEKAGPTYSALTNAIPASSPFYAITNPNESKKVIGNPNAAASIIKFVESHIDLTSDKLANAIAKIEDWDRKVGALDAILAEQKNSKTDMSELVVTGSQRLTTARTDATQARKDAIESFNEAVKIMNEETKSTGVRSPLFNDYKNSRDLMESKFYSTMAKDKSTMEKVMDYLKNTLTSDNLSKALNFINPLSDKY